MKITEIANECRTRARKNYGVVYDGVHGQSLAYDLCGSMLDGAVREIQNELAKVRVDAKNRELGGSARANAEAMVIMLEWVLGEGQLKS